MTDRIFSGKIVEWYQEHRRTLPWRRTKDPYRIWLSEIILQQTRVAQGLPYYRSFVKKYPRIQQLARASEREVLRLWQGLGYYSRARNLHACARMVSDKLGGKFPSTYDKLRELKGIGTYTAAAIASMAFGERVAVLDGNVFRVLARVFGMDEDITSTNGRKAFLHLANRLVPEEDPGTYNQAIMEFGALNCTPRAPHCDGCPIQRQCYAFQRDAQEILPVKKKAQKPTARYFVYVVVRSDKQWLMKKRTGRDIWSGLYDFPLLEFKSRPGSKTIASEVVRMTGLNKNLTATVAVSSEYRHVLSHQVISARFVEVAWPKRKIPDNKLFTGSRFYSIAQVRKLPKSVLISRHLTKHSVL